MTPPEKPRDSNPWRQASIALTIPMMLLAGPLVGYGMGWLIRRWAGWGSWVEYVFLGLGLVAGMRETFDIVRKLSS